MSQLRFFTKEEALKLNKKTSPTTFVYENDELNFIYYHPAVISTENSTIRKYRIRCSLNISKDEATEFKKRLLELLQTPEYWDLNMELKATFKFGKLVALVFYVPMHKVNNPAIHFKSVINDYLSLVRVLDEPLLPNTEVLDKEIDSTVMQELRQSIRQELLQEVREEVTTELKQRLTNDIQKLQDTIDSLFVIKESLKKSLKNL